MNSISEKVFQFVGTRVLKLLYNLSNPFQHFGGMILFLLKTLRTIPQVLKSRNILFAQMLQMGVNSLPLVFVIAIFAGATTAWQANYQLEGYVSVRYIGTAVSKSIILELGPVLIALVIAGRVGASIAAELGTMRVTEQIDALTSMAIDPMRYLVMPRFLSGVIMVPLLTLYAYFFGIYGGYFVSCQFLGISGHMFIAGIKSFFYILDIFVGLLKATIFGAGLSLMGCYYGFHTTGGAEGVGKAAIRAFVASSIFILISDFIIASFFF